MSKKIAIGLCIILTMVMLFGACAPMPEAEDTSTLGPVPDNDEAIVIAEINGEPVYRSEYLTTFNNMCSQYGISTDDAQMAGIVQEMAVETIVSEKVMFAKLDELGYMELTAEQEEAVQAQAQSELDMFIQYSMTQIEEELGEDYTEDELAAKITEYEENALQEVGMTRDDFVGYFRKQLAMENAMEELVGDVEPTEEEVRAQYDDKLAADKETITDAASFEAATQSGETPYVVPEGLRKVRHVLIKMDDDTVSEIYSLRSTDDEAAQALLEEGLETIQAEADEVLEKLQSGELTFEEAIAQYNDDQGMETYTEGYEVGEGYTAYVESFTEGAMSLQSIGDITDLVSTDYGYHIIEYTSDVEAETAVYEDVKETIRAEMIPTMQQQAWAELVESWKQEMDVTIYDEKL